MTISIFEFLDVNEATGDPIWPAARRRVAQALSATYLQIGEEAGKEIRAVMVYNDSSTTGVHLRVTKVSTGEDADQGDPYIGPDGKATFLIQRKDRTTTNPLYVNAVADA